MKWLSCNVLGEGIPPGRGRGRDAHAAMERVGKGCRESQSRGSSRELPVLGLIRAHPPDAA